jgi:class 3 adenylate cyclase
MFCDLVGWTALASRLDPEDLREVIGACLKCVAETIEQHDVLSPRICAMVC